MQVTSGIEYLCMDRPLCGCDGCAIAPVGHPGQPLCVWVEVNVNTNIVYLCMGAGHPRRPPHVHRQKSGCLQYTCSIFAHECATALAGLSFLPVQRCIVAPPRHAWTATALLGRCAWTATSLLERCAWTATTLLGRCACTATTHTSQLGRCV